MLSDINSVVAVLRQFADEDSIPLDEIATRSDGFDFLFTTGGFLFWGITTAFWVWMIVECLRKDPERYFWMFVIVFLHTIGAAIYFFLRWLPNHNVRLPASVRNMTRGSELRKLEIATQQIGNAHQFVQYGDALRETRQSAKGIAAYRSAIEKEPENLQALWGLSQLLIETGESSEAQPLLRQILQLDPQYKFGDVSMALGRSLCQSNQKQAALEHFREHIGRWRQPEGLYLLAELEAEAGNTDVAMQHLLELVMNVEASPTNVARMHAVWKSRAKKLMKRL